MASEMDWAYTACLSCDNQISEGEFCSQACRLADLEKGSGSEPNSPSTASSSSTSSRTPSRHSGFYLPPAVNFSSYRSSKKPSATSPTTPHYSNSSSTPYFTQSAASPSTYHRPSGLTPSSSRSSLASLTYGHPAHGISPQAASYLRGYVSSFDQVRDLKRRATNP